MWRKHCSSSGRVLRSVAQGEHMDHLDLAQVGSFDESFHEWRWHRAAWFDPDAIAGPDARHGLSSGLSHSRPCSDHFWFSIYLRIVCSSTAPTVAQKYPRAHRCCPQYHFRSSGNSSCSLCDDRPLMYCTNFAGDSCGGADSRMWMWSGDTARCTISTCRASHVCRIRSRARSAIRPFSTL